MNQKIASSNTTLTTIVRFHNRERLSFLKEAISSLATQNWDDLELVVALQNPDETLAQDVTDLIQDQQWRAKPSFKIVSVAVPENVDGRSELLNQGLKCANGRFVAFLDDDDIIYPDGYSTLIRQLLKGSAVIAVGGYRKAYLTRGANGWQVRKRTDSVVPLPSRLTLFQYNYIPLHSYVIDRSRLGEFELYFDNDLPPLEDYDFLVRLFAQFEPDFSCFGTPVCEYRIHELNSLGNALDRPEERSPAVQRSLDVIEARKETLQCKITARELATLAGELATLSAERDRLLHRIADRAHAITDGQPRLKGFIRNARGLLSRD